MKRLVECDSDRRELQIRFPYDPALVQLVKELPERRWHPKERFWSVPTDHLGTVVERLFPLGFEALFSPLIAFHLSSTSTPHSRSMYFLAMSP